MWQINFGNIVWIFRQKYLWGKIFQQQSKNVATNILLTFHCNIWCFCAKKILKITIDFRRRNYVFLFFNFLHEFNVSKPCFTAKRNLQMFPEKSNLFYLSVQKETSKLFLTNKVTKEKNQDHNLFYFKKKFTQR